jgi:hypothetical protein
MLHFQDSFVIWNQNMESEFQYIICVMCYILIFVRYCIIYQFRNSQGWNR